MAYSEYTVKSITSFKERTRLFRPRDEMRRLDTGSHRQEGGDTPQIRGYIGLDDPSTAWPEGSDTSSMAYSEYTVKSITSFKEQTSWFFWPRNDVEEKVD
jgi:hypothetical protein